MTLTARIVKITETLGLYIYTMRVDVGGVATVHPMIAVENGGSPYYINGGCPLSATAGEAFMRAFMKIDKRTAITFTVEV